ncbi:protoporphyrinogen oxidase [Paenibacillus pectinilyticus]|uniref:Coproporphyrinogen III oxidase n=1 Tax=Paenibacillus pectinilyticus TaxID=512399 RepID=A0A1C1A2Y4_9BACL|nr:protoporphyrinogen oxidase [Paenibacillus pectinilyticus]OCT14919.1 protoporphyrinogen oxidase [Paenibacillus pectinilyticus]
MSTKVPHYMIIGGGITGLSAAFYLKKQLEASGAPFRISVVEKSPKFGGKIHTLEREGFVIEKGPDSFLARKRPIIDLAYDLGLENELTGTNPKAKKTFIVRGRKLHPMPPGLVLGIPTQMTPFMKTGLISLGGKIRAAMDLILPKRNIAGDESLGHFLERRLGKEVLERIVEPLLAGIYAGDTYKLSLKSTFPQFRAMEQKHRSLILGMMASRKNVSEETAHLPAAIRSSVFVTFKRGLQTLVNGLVEALGTVDLRPEVGVAAVHQVDGEQAEVTFEDGHREIVDGLIVTTPTYQAAKILFELPAASQLAKIDYISVANVIMAFDRKDIPFELDASGFLVPKHEGYTITACTLTSAKWLHAAPEGKVLLRCYIGRAGEQAWPAWSDEELISKARHDINDLLGISAEPHFAEVTRLMQSMPQYPVDHLEKLVQFREELAALMPRVFVTGAGFHGVGLPDCIRQGKEAATQLADLVLHQMKQNAVAAAIG